jgi:glucose-6-phosphate dehydrogenase-like protein
VAYRSAFPGRIVAHYGSSSVVFRTPRDGFSAGLGIEQRRRASDRSGPGRRPFRTRSTEAYERLLHDAMAGDQTLFLREDAVERS